VDDEHFVTQECKVRSSVQKWLSSTLAVLAKFITTLFLLASHSFFEKQLLLPVETGILVEAPGSMQRIMLEV